MGTTRVSSTGPGTLVKVHYLGDAEEPELYVGAATRTEYHFGGKVNLGEVNSNDLTTGNSRSPGLLELTGEGGRKLFEVYVRPAQTGQTKSGKRIKGDSSGSGSVSSGKDKVGLSELPRNDSGSRKDVQD